jgi:predicted small secreted protein
MKNKTTASTNRGKSMKKMILLALTALTLAGCNTIAGVGEDVSAGARTVQETF